MGTLQLEMDDALRSLMREELGREPSDEELEQTKLLDEQMRIINEDLGKSLAAALESAFGQEPLALAVHDTL